MAPIAAFALVMLRAPPIFLAVTNNRVGFFGQPPTSAAAASSSSAAAAAFAILLEAGDLSLEVPNLAKEGIGGKGGGSGRAGCGWIGRCTLLFPRVKDGVDLFCRAVQLFLVPCLERLPKDEGQPVLSDGT